MLYTLARSRPLNLFTCDDQLVSVSAPCDDQRECCCIPYTVLIQSYDHADTRCINQKSRRQAVSMLKTVVASPIMLLTCVVCGTQNITSLTITKVNAIQAIIRILGVLIWRVRSWQPFRCATHAMCEKQGLLIIVICARAPSYLIKYWIHAYFYFLYHCH